MICNHERIGKAKMDPEHKPFCKDCWTRLRSEKMEPYFLNGKLIKKDIRYVERETFLDEFYRYKEAEKKKRKLLQIEPVAEESNT